MNEVPPVGGAQLPLENAGTPTSKPGSFTIKDPGAICVRWKFLWYRGTSLIRNTHPPKGPAQVPRHRATVGF